MRRHLPILVFLGLAAMAAVALAQVSKQPRASAAAISTSGAFEISNSEDGGPIFAAAGIAPGESTTGTVTIEDTGAEPVTLTLRRGELVDEPGLTGGLLSSRLRMTIVDITDASPRTVYAGPLDSMPQVPAGNLAGGASRTYAFVATLPAGGEPNLQNAVQGASTTVAYSWVASEATPEEKPGGEPGGGEPEGGKPVGGEPGSGGASAGGGDETSSGAGGPPGGDGASDGNGGVGGEGARLELRVPKIRWSAHRGRLTAWTDCSMSCRLSIHGRLRARSTKAGTRRVARVSWTSKALYAPGPHRVRFRIPSSMRAWTQSTPGHEHLRARLRFIAVGTDGERDVVRKTVRLRSLR